MSVRAYQLTVEGELGDNMSSAFPGMALSHGDGNTTLTGEIRDQAALQAVLRRLTDFGLTLLETKTISPRDEREQAPPGDQTKGADRA